MSVRAYGLHNMMTSVHITTNVQNMIYLIHIYLATWHDVPKDKNLIFTGKAIIKLNRKLGYAIVFNSNHRHPQ